MSDYVHNKVVRLPFPQEIMSKCNVDDVYDCEQYLKELLGELWDSRKNNGFKLECTDKGYYIDWVYYSTYGEESGDFGFVSFSPRSPPLFIYEPLPPIIKRLRR